MKSKIWILILSFFYLVSCSTNGEFIDDEQDQDIALNSDYQTETNVLNTTLETWNFDSRGEFVDIQYGEEKGLLFNNSGIDLRNLSELNYAESVTQTVQSDIGEIFSVYTVPFIDNPSRFASIVERANGETFGVVLTIENYDEESGTFTYSVDGDSSVYFRWGWGDCMQGVFRSHIGAIISTLGVASGLGCAACPFVAGFLIVVSAIGCAG